MNVTIFDAHEFERASLQQACDAAQARHTVTFLPVSLNETTAALAAGADVVSIFVNDTASEQVLERLAGLGVRCLALRSAGYNHVHLPTAQRLGIRVANVPAYSPFAVAEHAVALMLALNRRLIRANARVRDLNFSLDGLVGFDMNGKTAGIVGTGKIGSVVARILHGFGCNLLGYDAYPNAELTKSYGVRYVSMDELCSQSDIITLHAPLLEETKYCINKHTIGLMKRGAMLINTSRGGLVETKAVITALKSGHLGAVGLDVYEQEQGLFFHDFSDTVLQDDVITRLLTFPNVLITGHQAFLTDTALQNIADTTFQTIDDWSAGRASAHEIFV